VSTPLAQPGARLDSVRPEVPAFTTYRDGGLHPGQVHQWASGILHRLSEAERAVAELAGKVAEAAGRQPETPQGQRMIADLMKLASDELAGQRAGAAAEAQQLIDSAGAKRDQVITDAEAEAAQLIGAAREQVDTLLNEARAEAKAMLDSASARSAAVAEGADRRLAALTAQHEETIRRIRQVNQVTGSLLAGEQDRGSLPDEVSRALPAAVFAPAALTVSGEDSRR
jgi:cell division septum initiation protein DivIVA